jgi:type IV secretory pathway TrbD component
VSLSGEDRARRLAGKPHNERMKLITNSFNALAIAIAGVAVLLPGINEPVLLLTVKPWILISSALALHFVAHAVLGFLRSED